MLRVFAKGSDYNENRTGKQRNQVAVMLFATPAAPGLTEPIARGLTEPAEHRPKMPCEAGGWGPTTPFSALMQTRNRRTCKIFSYIAFPS